MLAIPVIPLPVVESSKKLFEWMQGLLRILWSGNTEQTDESKIMLSVNWEIGIICYLRHSVYLYCQLPCFDGEPGLTILYWRKCCAIVVLAIMFHSSQVCVEREPCIQSSFANSVTKEI